MKRKNDMKDYYIIDNNGTRVGPIDESELKNYGLSPDSYVWTPSMGTQWQRAADVADLQHFFITPPPTPIQSDNVTPPPINGETYSGTPYPPHTQPTYAPGYEYYRKPNQCPSTHLAFAIIVTVLCCIPFGIVAIIYASKVQAHWNANNYSAAKRASNISLIWCIISIIAGIIAAIFSFLVNSDFYYSSYSWY